MNIFFTLHYLNDSHSFVNDSLYLMSHLCIVSIVSFDSLVTIKANANLCEFAFIYDFRFN